MNKLSIRLEAVANYVNDNSKVIDIGCDHGFLSIFLAKKYDNIKIIASDINENALNNAISNINKMHLQNKIETRLGNGLDVVTADEIDTIVISGMGSNTIVGMLKYARNKLTYVKDIIVQSNTDLYFLRKNIVSLGYYIADETLVKDKNIIYTVIKFSKGKKKYNYKELYLGPILISKNDDLFREKNRKEINTLRMIVNGIGNGHYFYKKRLKRNIRILEKIGT